MERTASLVQYDNDDSPPHVTSHLADAVSGEELAAADAVDRSDDNAWVRGAPEDDAPAPAPFMCVSHVLLPPEPKGDVPPELARRVARWHASKGAQGVNAQLHRTKEFHNPNIYEKLVAFLDLCETGTNYPAGAGISRDFGPEAYYEELARAQIEYTDRRDRQRREQQQQRTAIPFVHSGRSSSAPSPTPASALQAAAAVAARLARAGPTGAGAAGQGHVAPPAPGSAPNANAAATAAALAVAQRLMQGRNLQGQPRR